MGLASTERALRNTMFNLLLSCRDYLGYLCRGSVN